MHHVFVFIKQKKCDRATVQVMKHANLNHVPSAFRFSVLTGEGRVCRLKLLQKKDDIYIFTVGQYSCLNLCQNHFLWWHEISSPLSATWCIKREWGSVYFSVPVGHQSDGHDVLQHGPGGEELLADEDSAGWTQTLIEQSDRHWRNRLVWSGSIHLHTLLLNLQEKQHTKQRR